MKDDEKLLEIIESCGIGHALSRLEIAAAQRALDHARKGETGSLEKWTRRMRILQIAHRRFLEA